MPFMRAPNCATGPHWRGLDSRTPMVTRPAGTVKRLDETVAAGFDWPSDRGDSSSNRSPSTRITSSWSRRRARPGLRSGWVKAETVAHALPEFVPLLRGPTTGVVAKDMAAEKDPAQRQQAERLPEGHCVPAEERRHQPVPQVLHDFAADGAHERDQDQHPRQRGRGDDDPFPFLSHVHVRV